MVSNYPPGVSDNTFSAPWNDIEKEIEFCITVNGLVSIQGPVHNKYLELELLHDAKEDVRKEIIKKLDEEFPEYEFT